MIIHDTTPSDVIFDKRFARGGEPRDYSVQPQEMFAPPSDIDLIPESDWRAVHEENEAQKAGFRYLRQSAYGSWIPSLDQNGQGYCWAYSTGMGIIATRALAGQPYVRVSPHAVACKIKDFRDQGGWSGLSAQFAREKGFPSESKWPQKSMSRSHDNVETWADAAKYKITHDYVDLGKQVWDQNLTYKQMMSHLLRRRVVMADFYWWGHAVLLIGTSFLDGQVVPRGINSWTDNWGDKGEFDLQGQRAIPNGAIALVSTTPG